MEPSHTSYEELLEKVEKAKQHVAVGEEYVHYKHPDRRYRVLQVGLIEENEEPCVVYQSPVSANLIWVRTLSNFLEDVTRADGRKVNRFQKVQ